VISVLQTPIHSRFARIEKATRCWFVTKMTDALQRSAVKVIIRQINPTGRLPVTMQIRIYHNRNEGGFAAGESQESKNQEVKNQAVKNQEVKSQESRNQESRESEEIKG